MNVALPVLGVDPGLNGGSSLLDAGGKPLYALTWRTTKAGRMYLRAMGQDEIEVPNHHVVALAILDGVQKLGIQRYVLAVEALFGKGNTLAVLSWTAGMLTGPLLQRAERLERPHVMQWRPRILGISGNAPAKVAADAACRFVPLRFRGFRETLGDELASNEHACESTCIAEYARTERK